MMRLTHAFPVNTRFCKPINYPIFFPMHFLPRGFSYGHRPGAGALKSHVVPVRDVQWGRPVFRPPELPSHPRLFNTVPFTAMRPLRPTCQDRHEINC